MTAWFVLIPVLLPIFGGVGMIAWCKQSENWKNKYMFLVVLVNAILAIFCIINTFVQGDFEQGFLTERTFVALRFSGSLTFAFRIDGLGMVFGTLVSVLWPLAVLYSFEYMEHDHHKDIFNAFYMATFGITLGIAWSSNLLTMYLFFELLTLVTTPLVIHELNHEANVAARKYLYYCIGGAAFGFISLVFMIMYGNGAEFVYGGCLDADKTAANMNLLLTVYVLGFFGFGVKAAIFPFHGWLPSATVAPTPVTALLHAVAVVKAGAFSVIRLTYYCYGASFLKGTWAQHVVMAATLITILFGSSMAVREQHFKKRLAYSTISNLSYILFGVTMMSPLGLVGALTHLVFHALMKICSFFCAGAVMHKSGKTYVYELEGMGRKMPKTFGCFTVASLALVGTPPLCGFITKWNLCRAALETGGLAYVGMAVLFISALLIAVYMLSIVIRAFFPKEGAVQYMSEDPGWRMLVPLYIFVIAIFAFGIHSAPLVHFFEAIAAGLL